MKVKLIIGLLILLFVAGGYWGLNGLEQSKSNKAAMASDILNKNLSEETIETNSPIIDDQEGIQVTAQWKGQEGTSTQRFLIGLNNHAMDLENFDFVQNVRVLLDKEEIPIEIRVLGKNGLGHHVSTELEIESPEFIKINEGSKLTLSIENVFDTPTRSFTWDL